MLRTFLIVVAFGSALLTVNDVAVAAPKTTIALTVTRPAAANEADHKLTDSLVALLELQVLEDDSLSVVERRQIDLALQELALSRSRSAAESLQLGKLATADLLVMLELRPPDRKNKNENPSAVLRVVEAKTAAIRGINVASDVDATSLEDIAEQFARYVVTVIREPQTPMITVAVAPFESVGRFDRLRPLELGIRDLVTARLLKHIGVDGRRSKVDGKVKPSTIDPQPSTFQVLQRSNLEHLLRELDLIQSGIADIDHLPRTLPNREAAFLIKGEIDERQVDGKFTIVVRGELRHAASAKVRASFEFQCPPTELEKQLAARVDELAKPLGNFDPSHISADTGPHGHEYHSLRSLALRDLHRFRRISPTDHGHRTFALTVKASQGNTPRLVKPDTSLGQALLKKSIDRLESSLFLHPEDAETAYALGFCFSIHQPGIYQPNRADELFRKVASMQPQSELAALALVFLSELAFDDQEGRFDPLPSSHTRQSVGSHVLANVATARSARDTAAERLWFAFERMPAEFRDSRWPRMLELFAPLQRSPEQNAALLEKLVPLTEQADDKHRHPLASEVKSLAVRLATQSLKLPNLKAIAIETFQRWAKSSDPQLTVVGRQGLAELGVVAKDHLAAAEQYEEAAATMSELTSFKDRHTRGVLLVRAATNYRRAKQPERALKLLQSYQPPPSAGTASNLFGMHGYEIGACYEALGDPQSALAAYLRAVEECRGISANSDLTERVIALGGVPLRDDRDVDVKYITREDQRPLRTTALATDGRRLFLGGVVFPQPRADATNNQPFFGGVGVAAFDPDSETWESLNTDLPVTALKLRGRELWIGTHDRGVWRYNLDSRQWRSFGKNEGLPDLHVESIAFESDRRLAAPGRKQTGEPGGVSPRTIDDSRSPGANATRLAKDTRDVGADVFIGVGSAAAGGLVRIDEHGTVHLFDGPDAPTAAPTHLMVTDKELLARTLMTVHRWSWETQTWTKLVNRTRGALGIAWRLFAGKSGIWASCYGRELTRWEADDETNSVFKPSWYFVPGTKAGYLVNFVAERGDEVWFGGGQWEHFNSSGLYRINPKTGVFHKFGPADGFKTVHAHSIFDGLWLGDRLWLATSNGLCVVTPRE